MYLMKKIITAMLLIALCFSVVACGDKTPDTPTTLGTTTVKVVTPSGKGVEGVYVFVNTHDGAPVAHARTNASGVAAFELSETSYSVSLDMLPAGHFAEESYTLNSSQLEITVKTSLIPENLGAQSYRVGDLMQDFTFTDCEGNSVKLSDVLSEKEAVVINYWFINCPFCNKEFPFLNEAYGEYSDRIELLGVNITASDTDSEIAAHKESYSLAFPMGRENCNTFTKFGFTGAPSTVIIDSDGIVRYRHEGAIMTTAEWRKIFDSVLA